MSAKRKSVTGDRYYTPKWCVRQCFEHVLPGAGVDAPRTVLEPSAGRGVFVHAISAAWPTAHLHALDKDPDVGPWKGADHSFLGQDFLKFMRDDAFEKGPRYDLAVGNPPFTLAREFVDRARMMARVVVYILRQGFFSSAERVEWLLETGTPAFRWELANRPGFGVPDEYVEDYKGGDSADYTWAVWVHGHDGPCLTRWLPPVSLEERKLG